MSDPQPDKNSDRIPRGAIAVVIVGLFLTVAVIALNLRGQDPLTKLEWATTEEVKSSPTADFGGKGEFSLNRTTLAAIPPNGEGELIYRVSGDVVIDSAGKKPTRIACRFSAPGANTSVAKTRSDIAVWPRPSDDLLVHEVPESLVVKFRADGNTVLEMPIRDSIRRYTNSASPTQTDWTNSPEDGLGTQVSTWDMPTGTGPGAAALGYAVVFRTSIKPETDITCKAKVGSNTATQKAKATQQEWPIPVDDAGGTQADPSLDVE